ncbi:MAG: AEC family transporter [Pseudomonadales bacterium]
MTLVSDIILPIFGLVILGFVAGKVGWIKTTAIEGLSTFVFTFAIPVMLFRSIALADLPEDIPWVFLSGYYGATLLLFAVTLIIGRLLQLDGVASSIFAMSASYSNVVLLGIPLIVASMGDDANVPLFIIISTHAAVMFLITTFCAETARGDRQNLATLPYQTLLVLARNMIVVGLVLGLAVNLSGLALPRTLDNMAAYLGSAALPCAVFSMGASISQYRISGDLLKISLAIGLKNLLHPLLVWLVCSQLLDLPASWTAVAVILAACPSGINAYLFANRYQAIVPSTATVVVLSTLISIPVLSLVLFLMVKGV